VSDTTQLPPNAPEMEASLIGCLLSGEAEHLNAALAEAKGEMFYDLRNATVFRCVEDMVSAGKPVSLVTVRQQLDDNGTLEHSGGVAHLNACLDSCVSPSMWSYFLESIRDKHTRRKLGAVCAAIGSCVDGPLGTDDLLDQAEQQLLAVRGTEVAGEATMKDHVMAVTARVEADLSGDGLRGLSTGFRALDVWTKGLKPQNLIIIAALTGMGKSALAMQMATRVAMEENLPVAVFSLEMTSEEITERIIRQRARWETSSGASERDIKAFVAAGSQVAKAPLHLIEDGGLSIAQIRAKARRLHQRHKLALIVVDYLQLVSGSGRKDTRTVEVSEVTKGLKEMAKELKVPVIALAQLNRASANEDRRPGLNDLREGGIEHHADVALLIHTKEDGTLMREVDIIVAKNRGNPRGVIPFRFNGPLTEFTEVGPIHINDVPATRRTLTHTT